MLQPIETAPKDGTPVVVYWQSWQMRCPVDCGVATWDDRRDGWLTMNDGFVFSVKWWHPVPKVSECRDAELNASEREFLKTMLSDTPESAVIDRMSIEARMKNIGG